MSNWNCFVFVFLFWNVGSSEVLDYKPPNKVISTELVCTDRDMQIHVLLEKPLTHPARIFVREQSADPRCVHHYDSNNDHNALMFRLPLSTCGMQRIQQKTNRFSFTTSIVVSFHRFFVSTHDQVFRITCDYARVQQPAKQVTAAVGVTDAEESDVDQVFPETAECTYQLLTRQNSSMTPARTVRVGDELEHVWKCEQLRPNQFIFVHDCAVNPEFTLEHDPVLIDSFGCVVDEFGLGPIEYAADGKSAKSRHLAYKFADYPNLLFKCSISVCQDNSCKFGDDSPLKIPPNCSKRIPRQIRQNSRNSIELSEVVRVEESFKPPESQTESFCLTGLVQIIICATTFTIFCFCLIVVFCCRRQQKPECHCSPMRIF